MLLCASFVWVVLLKQVHTASCCNALTASVRHDWRLCGCSGGKPYATTDTITEYILTYRVCALGVRTSCGAVLHTSGPLVGYLPNLLPSRCSALQRHATNLAEITMQSNCYCRCLLRCRGPDATYAQSMLLASSLEIAPYVKSLIVLNIRQQECPSSDGTL
jgi:hypothetical protein